MRKTLLFTFFVFCIFIAKAQESVFLKGDKKINIGMGVHSYPIGTLSLDYAIADDIFDDGTIGVGPYVGVGFSSLFTYYVVGGRGTFHYPLIDDLDTYCGVSVGLNYSTSKFRDNDLLVTPGVLIGANYPLNKNIIVFGELGTGVTFLSVGITLLID